MTGQEHPPITPDFPPSYHPVALRTGMAVTSLVLGIVAVVICPLLGIVAIILGIIALIKANQEPQRYGGRGMAIAGLTCGGASMFTGLILISILLPSLARARELSKRLVCASNMKAIGTAAKIYQHTFAGQGYPTLDILVARGDISSQQLICPSNERMAGNYVLIPTHPTTDPSPGDVLLYEPKSNHDNEGGNVLYGDGRVMFERSAGYDEVINRARGQAP